MAPGKKAGSRYFPQYWQCGTIWQAAARYRRIGVPAANAVDGGKAAQIAGKAFSSEVDTGSREKTRQIKNLELRL